jgi:insulysin
MQIYPPLLYIAGPRRLALDEIAKDPQLSSMPRSSFPTAQQLQKTRDEVQYYLSFLNVDNGIFTVLSKTFEGQTDKNEQWYGTNYRIRPIPLETLTAWRNSKSYRSLNMDFPIPNQFIPSEAGLRVKYIPDGSEKIRKNFEERMVPPKPPRVIRDDGREGRWTVYFKEDKTFGKPKGFVIFEILTNELFSSSKNAALANLYEISVTDKLREYTYDGTII